MRSAWKVVSNRTSDRTRRCPTRCADPVWTKQRGTRPGGAGRPTATHHHGYRHLVASLPPRDERSSPATSTVRLESAAWRQSSLACHFGRSELAQQAPQIPFVAQFRINSACGFYSFTYEQSGHSRSDGFEKVRAFSVLHLGLRLYSRVFS